MFFRQFSIKGYGIKSSLDEKTYDDIMSAVDEFWPMGFKHSNDAGRNVWIVRETLLKNKPHFVTFH